MQKFIKKKSLGQNFLKCGWVTGLMIKSADLNTETVLEIGPGKGVLTKKLLNEGLKVVAVEKDDRLIEFLSDTFKMEIESGALTLIHGDILATEIHTKILEKVGGITYGIIANIPYYITGNFFRLFLSDFKKKPNNMVILVQKEVAERMSNDAKNGGKESLLSISVKVYGKPIFIEKVPKSCFSPEPNVDSAIIKIENISNNFFEAKGGANNANSADSSRTKIDEQKFFELIHAGFSSKRKQVFSNIKNKIGIAIEAEALSKIGINPKARAEDLSIDDWREIYKIANKS